MPGTEAAIREMKRKRDDVGIICMRCGNEFDLHPDPSLLPLWRNLVDMAFDIIPMWSSRRLRQFGADDVA